MAVFKNFPISWLWWTFVPLPPIQQQQWGFFFSRHHSHSRLPLSLLYCLLWWCSFLLCTVRGSSVSWGEGRFLSKTQNTHTRIKLNQGDRSFPFEFFSMDILPWLNTHHLFNVFPHINKCSKKPTIWEGRSLFLFSFFWSRQLKQHYVVFLPENNSSHSHPHPFWGNRLTVSHLAFIFSFSNLANSRRSWMIISSFQMSRRARPMSTMPATTPATMGMISGPAGHSETETMHKWQINSMSLSVSQCPNFRSVFIPNSSEAPSYN